MMDGFSASKIARMEHEERVRALLREEQLLSDIVPEDDDAWVIHAISGGQTPHIGDLLSSVGKSLVSLWNRKRAIFSADRPTASGILR